MCESSSAALQIIMDESSRLRLNLKTLRQRIDPTIENITSIASTCFVFPFNAVRSCWVCFFDTCCMH